MKGIAILLFTVYIFGATDLHQVLRLPLLVSHYQKHRHELPSLSISQFLKIHYIDAQPFDKDYTDDMRLPFKAPKDHCISVVTILTGPVLLHLPSTEKIVNTYTVVEEDIPPYVIIRSIFQPPRVSPLRA